MYLSRLVLNPHSRQVQHELADPYEMHRTISKAFPKSTFHIDRRDDNSAGVLFRVDIHPLTGIPIVLVQSNVEPNWSFLALTKMNYLLVEGDSTMDKKNPTVKPISVELKADQVLAFRLRGNPTVKKDRTGEKQGHRIGLVNKEDQLAWLRRKINEAGGTVLSADLTREAYECGKLFVEKENKRRMHFISVQFDGILRVNDPNKFVRAVRAGVGSAKGFGFGLLSLAPAA